MCACVRACVHVCVPVRTCVHEQVCEQVWACVHMHVWVCACVCMWACACVCGGVYFVYLSMGIIVNVNEVYTSWVHGWLLEHIFDFLSRVQNIYQELETSLHLLPKKNAWVKVPTITVILAKSKFLFCMLPITPYTQVLLLPLIENIAY